jgi:hypothetical protein
MLKNIRWQQRLGKLEEQLWPLVEDFVFVMVLLLFSAIFKFMVRLFMDSGFWSDTFLTTSYIMSLIIYVGASTIVVLEIGKRLHEKYHAIPLNQEAKSTSDRQE